MSTGRSRSRNVCLQRKIFYDYLHRRGLKKTQQRETILNIFLSSESHLNVDELIDRVRATDSSIGNSTVYRTVNILLECGVAQQVRLRDDVRHIEPVRQDEHHDHFICEECGRTLEFFDATLELTQNTVSSRYGFKATRHSLKIFGICRECQRKEARKQQDHPESDKKSPK